MFIYTAILGAVILEYVAGQQVSISATNLTGVAGQDVPVSCFFTLGIGVDLVSSGSVMAPNFTRVFFNLTQTNYILRNVSRQNNNAQFYCQYFDDILAAKSAIATLSVWYLYPVPQFNPGAMVQKTVSQPLYLAVNVTANPAPTMAWYRNNVLLTNGTVPLNGDTGVASYSIASLVFNNAGNYTVVISNTAGSMTYSVMVMVDGQLTLSPTSFTLGENASFQVNCTHPPAVTVSLNGLTSRFTFISIGQTITLFTIPSVLRSDNNVQFSCTGNGGPSSSAPAMVTVYYLTVQPLFQSNLDVLSTTGDFFLNISIVANPFVIPANISVQTPPGVTLPPFSVIGKGDTGTAYIKIDLFQLPQYAGTYTITLRHPAVSTGVIIIQFTLTVLYAPRYTYSPTISNTTVDIYALPGTPQSLSCAATGVPQPTIVGLNSTFNSATNLYSFGSVSYSSAGLYVCVANNSLGSNTITYRLNIGATPTPTPKPSDATVQNGSITGAIAGGVLGGIIGLLLLVIVITFIYFLVCYRVRAVKKNNCDPMELKENTAYGVVHTSNKEAIDTKENTAYGVIAGADIEKAVSKFETVGRTRAH